MQFIKMNKIHHTTLQSRYIGIFITICVASIYMITAQSSVGFWESGMHIASGYGLQIPNPPGNPLYTLLSRIFTIISFGNVAYFISIVSVVSAAGTIWLLYNTVVYIALQITQRISAITHTHASILTIAAASISSLSCAFSHTFWNNATQASPYALTTFIAAYCIWALFRWEQTRRLSWLLSISIACGLLATSQPIYLIILPAIFLLYYIRTYNTRTVGILVILSAAFIFVAISIAWIIPAISYSLFLCELGCVNILSMPQHFGIFIGILIFITICIGGLYISYKAQKFRIHTIILTALLFCIAYSLNSLYVIRSNANTPIDQKNPEHAYNAYRYFTHNQQPEKPLWYGAVFNAPIVDYENTTPLYVFENNEYIQAYTPQIPVYDKYFTHFFPRMWSNNPLHIEEYKRWTNYEEGKNSKVIYTNGFTYNIPTFGQHIRFFISYQLNHMYVRYFMWNFAGQQNDILGNGEPHKGNWISGIPLIDNLRLGPQDSLPDTLQENKSRNTYLFIPFLLGIAGLILLIRRHKTYAGVIGLLFLCTSVIFVWYFNYTPLQARDRDYEFAISFYIFTICIGLGVIQLYCLLNQYFTKHVFYISIVVASLSPVLLFSQNFNNIQSTGQPIAEDFAKNLLTTCKPNAILLTSSDNDTYPLWYMQQVKGFRTDVRVINISLLSADWYIQSLRQQQYLSSPIPIQLPSRTYRLGTNESLFVLAHSPLAHIYYPIQDIMKLIASTDVRVKALMPNGSFVDYIPVPNIILPVHTAHALKSGIVNHADTNHLIKGIPFTPLKLNSDGSLRDSLVPKSTLAIMDILAHNQWNRPLYVSSLLYEENILNLNNYMYSHGLAYLLTPIELIGGRTDETYIKLDAMYNNLMHVYSWNNTNKNNNYINEYSQYLIMQYRTLFEQAAQSLFELNESIKALQLLDTCIQLFPHSTCNYNIEMIPIAKLYYHLGAKNKSKTICNELYYTLENNTLYYRTAPKKYEQTLLNDVLKDMEIAIELFEYALEIDDNIFAQKIAQTSTLFIEEYFSFTRQISVCLPQEFQASHIWVFQLQGNLPYIAYWYNNMKFYIQQRKQVI